MPKLTKRIVDAADVRQERYFLWDDEIKGFGLLVLPTGTKTFVFQYRAYGRSRRLTIGKLSGSLTPDQARLKAKKYRRNVEDKRDPLAEEQKRRKAPSVGDVFDAYLESPKFAEKADSTRAIDKGRIERHLRPLLGKKIADELTRADVTQARKAIITGKTAKDVKTKARGLARVRGGQAAARDCIGLLRAIFNWASAPDEGLIRGNPASGIELGKHRERDTIIEDTAGYKRLFAALDAMEADGRIRGPAADAIRLVALTGARRGEIIGARWRHVDLGSGAIVYPPEEHKTGRKTGKPRIIRLITAAQEIVAKQPAGDPDDLVFRPAKGAGPIAISAVWRDVRREAKLPTALGLHGLRHSVGSHLAMDGAQIAQIMTQLGHSKPSTALRYIHFAENARSKLADEAAKTALAGMAASKNTATEGEKEEAS